MRASIGRRFDDETPGEFEFQRTDKYPCDAHARWLERLDNRLWLVLLAACGGAVMSLLGLLVQLAHKGG
jgi:hypothetical protein